VLALEMLILLLENPSDDSVEMAVDFCKEVRPSRYSCGGGITPMQCWTLPGS
jgi:hypothetical protein